MTNSAQDYLVERNNQSDFPLHWIAIALGIILFFIILVKVDWSKKDWKFLEQPIGYAAIRQVLVLHEGELLVITDNNSLKGELDAHVSLESRNAIVKFFNNCTRPIVAASYLDDQCILHIQAELDGKKVDLTEWLVENSLAWKQ